MFLVLLKLHYFPYLQKALAVLAAQTGLEVLGVLVDLYYQYCLCPLGLLEFHLYHLDP